MMHTKTKTKTKSATKTQMIALAILGIAAAAALGYVGYRLPRQLSEGTFFSSTASQP